MQRLVDDLTPATAEPAPAPAPIPRGAPRLTALWLGEARAVGAVLAWDGQRWRAQATAVAPASGLEAALRGLLDGLARAGERPPRDAILLWSEVVAACLDAPAASSLAPERLEALLAWELDPYLPGEVTTGEGGQAAVACGWAPLQAAGPVLACGVRSARREEAREACARAGLRLRGLYPLLGCAAAEVAPGAAGPRAVLELVEGAVALTRLEGERVRAVRVARCAPGAEAATALGLIPDDAGLVLAGPVPASLRELGATTLPATPEAATLPAGLLGAARHALGLPGGARIAAVPAQRPLRLRLRGPAAWLAAWALLLAGLVSAGEAWTGRALRREQGQVRTLRQQAHGAAGTRPVEALRKELESARARVALARELEGRGAELPALLRALAAATPEALRIDRLREEPDGALRLEGVAMSELAVRELAARLGPSLAPFRLRVAEPQVTIRSDPRGELYGFVLECPRAGEVR